MTPNEHLKRRSFLMMACAAAAASGLGDISCTFLQAQAREPSIDHTIRIGPVSLELAPGKIVKTTGFNGTVPGPVLRLREGKPECDDAFAQMGQTSAIGCQADIPHTRFSVHS